MSDFQILLVFAVFVAAVFGYLELCERVRR